jgi:hypothetical protein
MIELSVLEQKARESDPRWSKILGESHARPEQRQVEIEESFSQVLESAFDNTPSEEAFKESQRAFVGVSALIYGTLASMVVLNYISEYLF